MANGSVKMTKASSTRLSCRVIDQAIHWINSAEDLDFKKIDKSVGDLLAAIEAKRDEIHANKLRSKQTEHRQAAADEP
jgi:hypothetical protein